MRIDEDFSRKMKVLSFAAMATVVLIHSKTNGENASDWNVFIQTFLNRGLSDWAVPFFFVASGFWFGKQIEDMSPSCFFHQGYGKFMRKKALSIIFPYLLWSVIGALLQLPLVCFNNHIKGRWLFQRTVFDANGAWGVIDNLLGITKAGPVGNMPLWFLRVLIIFFLLSPMWVLLTSCLPRACTALLGIVLLITQWNVHQPFTWLLWLDIDWPVIDNGRFSKVEPCVFVAAFAIWHTIRSPCRT